jgi:dolichol-phosphate mannosyltransferase
MNQSMSTDDSGNAIREDSESGSDPQLSFSIVIPTYNEEASIETTLDAIYEASPVSLSSFEIIVADESDDGTPEIVRNLNYPNLRLLQFDEPKGLAASVIEGFNVSNGAYVGVIDADGQHPPEKLFELFERAIEDDHDIVVASRYIENGAIKNWSWFRKVVSVGATAIAQFSLLRGGDIQDPLSGFFVFRRTIIDDLTLDPVGYKILLELLVKADPDSVVEVGYVFRDRDEGNSNLTFSSYLQYIVHVGKLVAHNLRN